MILWECITLAFILYVMVEVPYQLAFGIAEYRQPVCEWSFKVAVDITSCVVFLLDIVVQMHSASFVGKLKGVCCRMRLGTPARGGGFPLEGCRPLPGF
jgi:hypothetical protein